MSLDAGQVDLRGVFVTYRAGTSGQDDTLDGSVQDGDFVERMDFAEDAEFTQPTPDELGHLRAEIEDNDLFCHNGCKNNTKI